jgi:uncharacterized membrane protein/protein-disulfide isomerase
MPALRRLEPSAPQAAVAPSGRGPVAATGRDAPEGHHRAFVRWALVLTLLLGAGWGAHLLFEIGIAGRFDAVSPSDVVAHGMAQLWGFVALFVAGVALRHLPSATGRAPASRAVRRTILASVVLGVAASYLWSLRPASLAALGPASAALLALGAAGYAAFLRGQLRGRSDPFALAVAASGLWLVLWAGLTLALASRDPSSGPGAFSPRERLLSMELPLFGLALGSVYAFGPRLLPGFLACRPPPHGVLLATLALHNVGLLTLVGGRVAARPAIVASGLALVLAAAVLFVVALRRPRGRAALPSRSPAPAVLAWTIRVALLWLPLSLGAMTALALAEAVGGTEMPHAYHGATRHAFTVGFLVTLMLGIGQRLLPVLGGRPPAPPPWAGAIFALLSAGNALRIATQVATERFAVAYAVLPLSSVLELLAIALFAVAAWRATSRPPRVEPRRRTPGEGSRGRPALVGLRLAALVGTAASATLLADVVRPGRGFCPLKRGCAEASASPLGSLLGVPTAAVGAVAFLGLLFLTIVGTRWARALIRPAALLAALGGAAFLSYQALALAAFCPFCVIADAAGLAAGLAVLGGAGAALDGVARARGRWAWGALAGALVAGPLLWPRAERPAWTEVPPIAASEGELAPLRETGEVAGVPVNPSAPSAEAATPATAPPIDSITAAVAGDPGAEEPGPVEVLPSAEDVAPAQPDPPRPTAAGPEEPAVSDMSHASPPPESPAVEVPSRQVPFDLPPPAAMPPLPAAPPATPSATPTAPAAPAPAAREPSSPPAAAPPSALPSVALVEFLNPFCAHCRATHARLDRAVGSAEARVVRYRVYVWSSPTPPLWARACAAAAAAGKEDALFSELLSCDRDTPESIWGAARRVGLDVRALSAAVDRGDVAARLAAERRRVEASSLRALPTLDVGRRRLEGEQSEAEIRAAIRAAAVGPR